MSCPVCDYDGKVAETNDYKYEYFTHVFVYENGEVFRGKTCSRPIYRGSGLLDSLIREIFE